jgi:hypothetical protein
MRHPPPLKRRTRLTSSNVTGQELRATSKEYHQPFPEQVFSNQWGSHAGILLEAYWRTGQLRHLLAFVRHIIGMRARLVEGRL